MKREDILTDFVFGIFGEVIGFGFAKLVKTIMVANVLKAAGGSVDDIISKADDLFEVIIKYEDDLPISEFTRKVNALLRLSDDGLLFKAKNPVSRNKNLPGAYKKKIIEEIWNQYSERNPSFANALIRRVKDMQVDHVWDLQLGGPDIPSNFRLLDAGTNENIGRQIWNQIRTLPDGTPINIIIQW